MLPCGAVSALPGSADSISHRPLNRAAINIAELFCHVGVKDFCDAMRAVLCVVGDCNAELLVSTPMDWYAQLLKLSSDKLLHIFLVS